MLNFMYQFLFTFILWMLLAITGHAQAALPGSIPATTRPASNRGNCSARLYWDSRDWKSYGPGDSPCNWPPVLLAQSQQPAAKLPTPPPSLAATQVPVAISEVNALKFELLAYKVRDLEGEAEKIRNQQRDLYAAICKDAGITAVDFKSLAETCSVDLAGRTVTKTAPKQK